MLESGQDCDSCCRGFEPHQPPQYSCALETFLVSRAFLFLIPCKGGCKTDWSQFLGRVLVFSKNRDPIFNTLTLSMHHIGLHWAETYPWHHGVCGDAGEKCSTYSIKGAMQYNELKVTPWLVGRQKPVRKRKKH